MRYILWWRGTPDLTEGLYNNISGQPQIFDNVKDAVSFILNHLGRSYFQYKQLLYDVKTWPELKTVYQFPNDLKSFVDITQEAIVADDLTYQIVPVDPSRGIETSKSWYKKVKA